MDLRMLVYIRTRDGSQNVGLPENKKWLSKFWLHKKKRWLSEKVMAVPFVYMRKRDGSQNFGLHGTRDGSQNFGLHENKRSLSKQWFT